MKSYRDLIVWQRSMELVKAVYVLTGVFPSQEQFGLTAQMRRSAVSVPSNIAEGFARKGRGEYARFINIAYSSAAELETQLEITKMLKLGNDTERKEAHAPLVEVLKMLNVLHAKLRQNTNG